MSSLIRRIELKVLRAKKLVPQRHKAINRFKGIPYRNCIVLKRCELTGAILLWKKYH
jgi:hypothetical protein